MKISFALQNWNRFGSGPPFGSRRDKWSYGLRVGDFSYSIGPTYSPRGRWVGYQLTVFPSHHSGHAWIDREGHENYMPLSKTSYRRPQEAASAARRHFYGDSWRAMEPKKRKPTTAAPKKQRGLCPICGERVRLVGRTKDGRLIGSCGDAFTLKQWSRR